MVKYISMKPRGTRWSDAIGDDVIDDTITVFDEEFVPEYTGLVDQHGIDLYRVESKRPIGFDISRAVHKVIENTKASKKSKTSRGKSLPQKARYTFALASRARKTR